MKSKYLWIALQTCSFMFLTVSSLTAQTDRPEVFGMLHVGRVSSDEGSLGNSIGAGGSVTLPITRRWAVDLGVDHLRSDRSVGDRTLFGRHTHISPGLQYRRGRERLYGFVTFGPGVAIDTEGSDFSGARLANTTTGLQGHAKAGFVAALSERFLVRADLFTTFRYVMPDIGVRVGLGYRF